MYRFITLLPQEISVDRATRQRERGKEKLDVTDLIRSIKTHGVLQPVIIDRDKRLIAGERRLTACRELGIPVPCRFLDELPATEARIIELEENLRRKDLSWQDNAQAISELHELFLKEKSASGWTKAQTAEALNLSPGYISMCCRVVSEFDKEKIRTAPNISAAHNMLSRRDQRLLDDALSDVMEAGKSVFEPTQLTPVAQVMFKPAVGQISQPEPYTAKSPVQETVESIFCDNFIAWSQQYSGKPFNFIHCDFPYGVNLFGGNMSGRQSRTEYKDAKDVYWELCAAFSTNINKIMSQSAHLMFWFSMEYYSETLDFFRKNAPSLTFHNKPLIWLKSDNMGIVSDPRRGPRHIYETALIASRDDRFIVSPISNAYAAPTAKDTEAHPSTKPVPVLKHFFQLFVDENTRMLDPTCGGGTSLRAAESLGAQQVLGIELNKEFSEQAKSALRKFRVLRATEKKTGK